jgi:DNA-binding LacI/PurR family transcriptional regulator
MFRRSDCKAMSTVNAVATHAGVSAQTVSRVLRGSGYVSEATRAKVLASVEALGYRPNAVGQALRSTRTKMVGLIVSDVTNPFYARLHRAVERVLGAEGLSLMLLNTGDDAATEQIQLDLAHSYRPSGFLIVPAVGSTLTAERLQGLGACVLVSRTLHGIDVPTVVTNETEVTRASTEELLRAGHRDVLAVLGFAGTSTSERREEGYCAAMQAAGLRPRIQYTDQTRLTARAMIAEALRVSPEVTGVVAFNEPVTLGALGAFHDLGLSCPGDVSLIGFTDAPWMELFRPPLTAVSQPVEELGKRAAQLLIDLIAECDPGETHPVVPSHLIIRRSVAAPAAPRRTNSPRKNGLRP